MAEQKQQPPTVATAFPTPPLYYQHFTKANVELHQSSLSQGSSTEDLPTELQFLRPPTPPANGEYRSFGEQRSLSAPLPPMDSLKLHSTPPNPSMLLNLTRSLLLNFLELLHILSSNPSSEEYGPKWEDMRDLFRNAHEILNLYRPWQSRAALIGIMEDMISKGREEIESVKTLKQNVDSVLKGLQESLAAEEKNAWLSGEEPNGTENKRTGEESRMWSSIIDEVDQE